MRTPLTACLAAMLLLASCASVSQSRLNPFNWFGASQPETLVPAGGYRVAQDSRPLVGTVSEMVVEQIPGGALVRASGIPDTQGYWAAELVPEHDMLPRDGVLSFRSVAAPPITPKPAGTESSRQITAAIFVPTPRLQDVQVITVRGAQTQRSARR